MVFRIRRTVFIAMAAVAVSAGFACVSAQAPSTAPAPADDAYLADWSLPSAERDFQEVSERVAPHIWAIHPRTAFTPIPQGNQMVIEQSDGLVLVDAGKTRGDGKRIVALIRQMSLKPVKAVIITHWHPDHVLGIGPIMEAWPGAKIVSSVATRDAILSDQNYFKDVPRALADTAARDAARRGAMIAYVREYDPKMHDPKATAEERRHYADLVGVLKMRADDEQGTYLVPPSVTFTDHYAIDDADAPVDARFVGPGHTAGDVVVWAPKQRVVAAGDLVVAPIPYGGERALEYADALRNLRALHPLAVVPGHGPVLHGTGFVDRMIAAFDEMQAKVAPLVAGPALTEEQVQAKVDLTAQRGIFSGGDPWLAYWYDQYMAPNVVQFYTELRARRTASAPH